MANVIKLRRSSVSGKVPTTSDLALGELGVNTFDGKLYTKKNNGTDSVVLLSERPTSFGNIYLKNNTVATPIDTIAERAIVSGTATGATISHEFTADTSQTKGLEYIGTDTILAYFSASLSMSVTGNNRKLGVYLCINRDGVTLSEDDRLTETEVYQFASQVRNETVFLHGINTLSTGDRVYLRVQNDTSTDDITVEFFNLIARSAGPYSP